MSGLKKKFLQFFEKNKHLLILLYFFVYLAWFAYVERTVTTNFHVIHTPLDDLIPFCEYFVIPYLLWFVYVAWGVVYFAFHNKSEYYKLCAFLFSGMTIFLIVSTVYPNGHYLRPTYFTHHNFCTMLCDFLYSTDTATNLFPSIHEYKNNRIVKLLSGTLATAIILSTMFIKQHSTFDVLTAFLLAFIMYRVVYVHNWSKASQKSPRRVKNGLTKTEL